MPQPEEVADGIHQLRAGGAKVTVLTGADNTVLVDAGGRGSHGRITKGLRALGLSPGQVGLISLTHYHPDHTGGLGKLVEVTSARVAAHRLEAGILDGTVPAPSPFRRQVVAGITRPLMGSLYGSPVTVDLPLEDDDRLPVDRDIRTVHVPGHTPGSICLYLASEGVLIVGDALQYRFRRLSPPAAAVTQDSKQALESLKKLLELDFDTIVFSHFSPLREKARDSLRQLVERLDI